MTVEIRIEKVMFHKVVNIPEKKNCDRCEFAGYNLCSLGVGELKDLCDRGELGYWTFGRICKGVLHDD